MITQNLKQTQNNIAEAAKKSGRTSDDILLVAVSKTKPLSALQEAYNAGIRDFGENKVQELCDKYDQLPKDIRWHMIGHLQKNKVRQVIDKTVLIHSVDTVALAEQIEKEAAKKNIDVDILLEVNIGEEESKYGFRAGEVLEAVTIISKFSHVHIKGLMTIAPFVENSEENRDIFLKLYQLNVDIKSKNIDNVNMAVLSMGMTGDYMTAIEEGATMIRVGTGIFGARTKMGENLV